MFFFVASYVASSFILHSRAGLYNGFLQVVTSLADPSANIIFGAVVDDRYTGEIHVTIIATGFSQSFQKTLLTDPKAAKIAEAQAQEMKAASSPLQASKSAPVPSRPRKLFFWSDSILSADHSLVRKLDHLMQYVNMWSLTCFVPFALYSQLSSYANVKELSQWQLVSDGSH